MELHEFQPNKSSILEFPTVPEPFMHHFIRGYFDGDGYVNQQFLANYEESKNLEQACNATGIVKATLNGWLKKDVDFLKDI
ncbi:hypothetical protein SAMN05216244_0412 [Sediminibacillus halophilus]|uniref:Uncharacterized protein n=2 Tax=Sediminibacillus halophilus TaxID=482461 RepID=A0A1G9M3Y7_9BACI|nr:hypothetical protein SAMN05216244_0412 [Sediminibacillus halophilus]